MENKLKKLKEIVKACDVLEKEIVELKGDLSRLSDSNISYVYLKDGECVYLANDIIEKTSLYIREQIQRTIISKTNSIAYWLYGSDEVKGVKSELLSSDDDLRESIQDYNKGGDFNTIYKEK